MERKPNEAIGVEKTGQGEPMLDPGTKESVKQTARQVQDQAQNSARQAKGKAERIAGEAKQTAREIGDEVDQATDGLQREVGQQARAVGQQVERAAISQVERGRHQVAQGVHTAAEALRMGAQQVSQRDGSGNTQFVERLAEPVERVSTYLERHDTREIAHDLENFARRNEGLFLSGAFALGVLGARFLKSSSTEMQGSRDQGMDWHRQTGRLPDARQDAVGRPRAPGYAPSVERTAMGDAPDATGPRNR